MLSYPPKIFSFWRLIKCTLSLKFFMKHFMSLLQYFFLPFPKEKVHLTGLQSDNFFGGYESKIVYHKEFFFGIQCILDYAQHHLVDFWKKTPANFNFIWLKLNSFNFSIQFHIVWSSSSIFKLKCSVDRGWYLCGYT